MDALGTQLDEIANGFLGLPVPGHFFEYISKLVAEEEHEETTVGAKIHNKIHEAVKEKLIKTLFEQLKSKHAQLEPNPDQNFELIDDHTKFFHFLLAKRAEEYKLTNAADICLPMVRSFKINNLFMTLQCWTEGRSSTAVAEDLRPTATATVAEVLGHIYGRRFYWKFS